MRSALLPLTLVALFVCTETALALTISDDLHDAADDFSLLAGNANGVWTYGSLDSAGAFTAFTESFTVPGTSITSWRRNEAGTGTPGFYFNAGTNLFFDGATELQIGELICAPGNNSLCNLRFTAPADGTYQITASFEGLRVLSASKPSGTTTDVLILKNGAALSPTLLVRGFRGPSEQSFMGTLALTQGAHLDFAVSGASDGFASDATGMEVRIELQPIPVPAAWGLMLAGIGLLSGVRRRTSTE